MRGWAVLPESEGYSVFVEAEEEGRRILRKLIARTRSRSIAAMLERRLFQHALVSGIYSTGTGASITAAIPYLGDDGATIIGAPGSVLARLVNELRDAGIDVSVIGTTVRPPMVKASDLSPVPYIVAPPMRCIDIHFRHVSKIVDVVKVNAKGNPAEKKEATRLIARALSIVDELDGRTVVLLNKELVLKLTRLLVENGYVLRTKEWLKAINPSSSAKEFIKGVIEVHGDSERNVIDYVVVKKYFAALSPEEYREILEDTDENGLVWKEILLMNIHGRMSMGIDPPILDVDNIVLLAGLRSRLRKCLPIPGRPGRFLRATLAAGKPVIWYDFEGLDPEIVVIDNGKCVRVYDYYDFNRDLHDFEQVIGRWMRVRKRIVIVASSKYYEYLLKSIYYATRGMVEGLLMKTNRTASDKVRRDLDAMVEEDRENVMKLLRESKENMKDIAMSNRGYVLFENRELRYRVQRIYGKRVAIRNRRVTITIPRGYNKLDEIVRDLIDPEWLEKRIQEIMYKKYRSLNNYYSALRFVKKQLKYKNLPRHRLGMIPRIIRGIIRGFEYAAEHGKEVPTGLRKLFRTYIEEGPRAVAERLAEEILLSAHPETRPRVMSVLRRALLPIPLLG